MEDVVLGFGSNLGTRAAFIDAAWALLRAAPGITPVARSYFYETPPLGPPQPDYYNAAGRVRWAGTLEGLLTLTATVEALLLRTRALRWGPRTLDIDLLSAASGAYASARLTLPHPGLYQRPFALAPLCDLAPPWEDVAQLRTGLPPAQPLAHPVSVHDRRGERFVAGDDRDEWLARSVSEAVEVAWLCTAERVPSPSGALGCLGFALPEAGPEALLAALHARAKAAFASGFSVLSAAITGVRGGHVCGLFAGVHGGPALVLPAVQALPPGAPGRGAGRYGARLSRA